MNCAVFASGGGSNFQSLIDHRESGELSAVLKVLVCNNSGALAMERARRHGIPAVHCAPSHFPDQTAYSARLLEILTGNKIDLIVLAGYMKMIPATLISRFANRIVNIHPGLLPAFGGKGLFGQHVHEAVLAYGAKISGITVHFVDEQYDHGPIITQQTVPVLDDDTPATLAARVLQLEHHWYWRVIDAIARGRVKVEGRHVHATL